jgi:hypothetical protein
VVWGFQTATAKITLDKIDADAPQHRHCGRVHHVLRDGDFAHGIRHTDEVA